MSHNTNSHLLDRYFIIYDTEDGAGQINTQLPETVYVSCGRKNRPHKSRAAILSVSGKMCIRSRGIISVYMICPGDRAVMGSQCFQAGGIKHFPSPSLDFLCSLCSSEEKQEIILRHDGWKIVTLGRGKIRWRWPTWVWLQYWIDLQTAASRAFREEQLWARRNQRAGDNCQGGWGRSRIQQNPHHGCRCCPHRLSENTVKSIYSLDQEGTVNCHDHF